MDNIFLIIGGGFGLYGYLPAVMLGGYQVLLPRLYQEKILARPELIPYFSKIRWTDDWEGALPECNSVIIALPPSEQFYWVQRCLKFRNIKRVVLEKPVAVDAVSAKKTLGLIKSAGLDFRISYLFFYADWWASVTNLINTGASGKIAIDWSFMAHHYSKNVVNWKRIITFGGGVTKFYGIHLMALAAYHGYDDVLTSKVFSSVSNEAEKWEVVFSGKNLPALEMNINSRSPVERFLINFQSFVDLKNKIEIVNFSHPFESGDVHINNSDFRVSYLCKLLDSFVESGDLLNNKYYNWCDKILELWQIIEQKTSVDLHNN